MVQTAEKCLDGVRKQETLGNFQRLIAGKGWEEAKLRLVAFSR